MQITLRFYLDKGAFTDSLISDLKDSIDYEEGITLVTAGGKYYLDLDSLEVR